ncbi:MAG TPA: NERD domain-containing protein/DEAD/DEAH box helicase [Ktedonobacteraceae bacterium]|nr:NERD domain-containing protein/DEAD/DEAH box helicase [Ktedonobacteraceae bacterium]
MAQMYPTPMNPNTVSQAERTLYALFRDQLDDAYLVFHSVTWLWAGERGAARDGEADFVIVHPTQGVLVLEVKGGGISRSKRTGVWTSIGHDGTVYQIKNPLDQARTNKFALLQVLKASIKHYVVIGHAVAFPDIQVGSAQLDPDLPPEILLDKSHLSSLATWVKRAMRHWWYDERSDRRLALGEPGVRAILSILGKQWAFRPALWDSMKAERQELLRLTEEQYLLLDVLGHQRQALVSGFAGSGKTMLAVEKAVRLEQQGFRVLLVCYNSNLATDLRSRSGWGRNLHIYHFHDLCMKIAQQTGMDEIVKADRSDQDHYFRAVLPQALKGTAQRRRVVYPYIPWTYHAIIVDEGQDFYEEWWEALQELFPQGQASIFYIFYDNHQRLYPTPLKYPLPLEPYPLVVNCRTTQAIHHQIMRFYPEKERIKVHGPQGRAPLSISYPQGALQQTLEATIARLTKEEGIPLDAIMVLTPFGWRNSQIRTVEGVMSWIPFQRKEAAFISSIHAAKGLERPVVVLAELERRFPDERQRVALERSLYIACGRAQQHLLFLLTEPLPHLLQEAFPS